MAISGVGWELELVRLGQHQGRRLIRTYGSYAVHIDGKRVDGLNGFMVECQGPGENDRVCDQNYRRRIREDTYPLYTHDTHYASIGYSQTATSPTDEHPMPGFGLGLKPTDARSGILVHPAHDGGLYLASIGCLNPTGPLGPHDDMDIDDSRRRVIDVIDSLKAHDAAAFASRGARRIHAATIVIEGEPLNFL